MNNTMEQTSYTTRVLTPSKGYIITQADDSIALKERIFSEKIYLAVTDAPENYKEIPVAEAETLKRQQQAEADAETNEALK